MSSDKINSGAWLTLMRLSLRDWMRAVGMWRLWTSLAWEDLRDRYRRTVFGVSWILISFGLFILVYMTIFGRNSGVSAAEYSLYVTIGFGLWSFINGTISDGCLAYTSSTNWILGTSIPYPVFFLQILFRDWLIFLIIIIVMCLALVQGKDHFSAQMLWALPGLLTYTITPLWLSAILAPLCTRYRDAAHATQTVLRVLFFVTPILWLPAQHAQLTIIAKYNVLTYFIDIVRAPLLYGIFPYQSWVVVLLVNAVGMALGFAVYTVTRNRIVYWL